MREILFKAKWKDNDKWVEGYYLRDQYHRSGKDIIFYRKDSDRFTVYTNIIDIETLCQFTGLCDRYGNKIWENDIIKYHFGEIYAPIKYGCYQNCFDSQKTEHVGFYVDWPDGQYLRKDLGYWINMVGTMPVGNIFDNPELLQEESDE